jgi:hypothetical protein
MSSTIGDTEISADDIHQVEDSTSTNGEAEHTYGSNRSGWDGNTSNSICNNDDDDDDDNWSRQVETDDTIHRMPSSVTGGGSNTIDDDDDGQGASAAVVDSPGQEHQSVLIPQPRPLPTMKEKLVERERQRRVESERARWKRQFAMAAHAEAEHDEDDNNNGASGGADTSGYNVTSSAMADHDRSFVTDRNSVAGTVGEDTVAPIDTLEEDNNESKMNYPMERFLQDRHETEIEGNGDRSNQNNNTKKETQGVVMERFLQEQPTGPANAFVTGAGGSLPSSSAAPSHADSVPNESSGRQIISNELPHLDLRSSDSTTSNIDNELPGEPIGDNDFLSPSQQPRLVLRLTEAEIQEMAAIDDASRSNAPPSERDDISELGELISEFGTGLTHTFDNQNMSQGTPVTAMESVTSSLGNQIGQITELSASLSDHGGIDGIEGHSMSSNVVASSAGGDASLTGNPPSEVARDDDDDAGEIMSPGSSQVPTEILPTRSTVDVLSPPFATVPIADTNGSNDDSGTELKLTASNDNIVNRTMRPGLFNYKGRKQDDSVGDLSDSYTPKKMSKSPNNTDVDHHIEGFDFDKNNYDSSPRGDIVASRNNLWSPGFSDNNSMPDYRAMTTATEDNDQKPQTPRFGAESRTENIERRTKNEANDDENKPLLGGNVTEKNHRSWGSLWSIRNRKDLHSLAESVFRDIRSEHTSTGLSSTSKHEAEDYVSDSALLKRAFPERMVALMVALCIEMPTLFLISGGSDKLCNFIGRTNYTTLVALLPIVSAMSGNVGLQASALTTRAIGHGQLQVENYSSWMVKEIGAAVYLGKRSFL